MCLGIGGGSENKNIHYRENLEEVVFGKVFVRVMFVELVKTLAGQSRIVKVGTAGSVGLRG